LSVHVELNLVAGEGVGKTEAGLLEFQVLELFVLKEAEEMLADASDELSDEGRSSCLDLKVLVDRAGKVFLAHSQFRFGFFLRGEVLSEEIDELLWSLSCEGATDDSEGNCR
jgi:hypothetical protein